MEILKVVEMRPRYHLCTNASNSSNSEETHAGP